MRGMWAYLSDSGAHAWFLRLFNSMRDAWAYLSDSGIFIRRSCLISILFLFYAGCVSLPFWLWYLYYALMLDFYAFFILCGACELTFLTLVSLLGAHAWFLCLFYSMRGAWAYLSDSGISIRRSCFCVEPRRVLAARDDRRRESSFEALSTTPAHKEKASKKVVFISTTVFLLNTVLY